MLHAQLGRALKHLQWCTTGIIVRMGFEYLGYEEARSRPNVVVDGSPNESTVLTLTHWPGYGAPSGIEADLSAEMAFRYLDTPCDHEPASAVTTDHFDQDAVAAVLALTDPEWSRSHRELLIDLASAGDFAVYQDRRAARASMALSMLAEEQMTTDYGSFTDRLFRKALPMTKELLLDPEPFRALWEAEDTELDMCERAIETGRITIEEDPELDLAVVTVPPDFGVGGHRFGGMHHEGTHPMALCNRTPCSRLLELIGDRYLYTDRYESWVQVVSREIPRRRDLRPLAEVLTSMETDGESWTACGPGSLTPKLRHTGSSTIPADEVVARVKRHLAKQPPAWNPFDPANPTG